MDIYCRLCLRQDTNNKFTEFYRPMNCSITIYETYNLFTAIVFEDQEEQNNSRICEECLQNLAFFYDQRVQAIKNNGLIEKIKCNGYSILLDPHIEIKQEFVEEITVGSFEIVEDPFKTVYSITELKTEGDSEDLKAFGILGASDNLPDSNHNTKAPRVSIIKPKRLKYNGDVKPNPKGIISKDGLRITCDICFKSFSKSSFNQHYKFFHINPYICDVCLKTFGNKDYLEYHLKKHYGIRDVDCSDCDRKFHHKIDYFVHYNSKHKVEPETTCTYPNCTAVFKKKRILAEHIKFVHLNERNYLCPVCSKSFYTRTKLKRHESSHEVDLNYDCSFESCVEKFASLDKMKRHYKVSHAPNKFFCDHCPKAYNIASKMRVHIQQAHQKMSPTLKKPKITKPRNTKQKITKLTSTKMNLERTFNVPAEHACPQCEMSFTTCSQLKTHTIMHFKRTQCLHCSSTFSTIKTIRSYRRHAKTVHRMMEESKMKQFMELINRLKPDFERMEWTQ